MSSRAVSARARLSPAGYSNAPRNRRRALCPRGCAVTLRVSFEWPTTSQAWSIRLSKQRMVDSKSMQWMLRNRSSMPSSAVARSSAGRPSWRCQSLLPVRYWQTLPLRWELRHAEFGTTPQIARNQTRIQTFAIRFQTRQGTLVSVCGTSMPIAANQVPDQAVMADEPRCAPWSICPSCC